MSGAWDEAGQQMRDSAPSIGRVLTEEFGRMNSASDYVSLVVTTHRIIERTVVGGKVTHERELDEIPEGWPKSREFWGGKR